MSAPTIAPLVIMSIVAPLGALDVLYFHLYKFRLHARRASRLETVTHLARGALFAAVAFVFARYEPHGSWYWVVVALVGLDFLNNVADVLLEPKSRASLGGLPPAEYAIHIIGATASGVIGATWVIVGRPLAALPTALAPPPEMPGWLATNAHVLYIGAIAMMLGETALMIRAMPRRPPVLAA